MNPPTPRWVAYTALMLVVGIGLLLVWSPVRAQGFRGRPPFNPNLPPRLPSNPPGGPNNPPQFPGIPGFIHVWKCSKCGKELGRGKSLLDEPHFSSCPFCGARFINGGFGMNRGNTPESNVPQTRADPSNPANGTQNPTQETATNVTANTSAPAAASNPSGGINTPGLRFVGLVVLTVGFSLLIILGFVVFAVVKASNRRAAPRRLRSRARPSLDD
jgi:hypothetical protein